MIPYINFVNYSKDYNWFLELIKPQPSPFTETINRNIDILGLSETKLTNSNGIWSFSY